MVRLRLPYGYSVGLAVFNMVHVIYKGATQPAMIKGVPLVPFMVSAMAILILADIESRYLSSVWLLVLIPLVYVVMRIVSVGDAHYLNQWILRFKLRQGDKNRRFHGAVVYSANDYGHDD